MKSQLAAGVILLASWASGAAASPLAELIAKGDAADARHDNRAALAFYEQATTLSHNNPALLRRIAKQKAQLILDAPNPADKKRLAAESLELARRAVELAPQNSENHLTLAIVLGRAAFFEPPRQKIASAREIRSAAEKAVSLDPSNDIAWHVLGRWHFEMATLNPVLRAAAVALFGRIPEAALQDAARCFEKAIAKGPPRAMHHIEYGRTLAAMNLRDEAIAQIRKGLSIPDSEKDDRTTKNRGRETLRRLNAAPAS